MTNPSSDNDRALSEAIQRVIFTPTRCVCGTLRPGESCPAHPFDPSAESPVSTLENLGVLGYATTFSCTCPYGCTVLVVEGREQRHDCAGERLIREVLDSYGLTDDGTDGRVVARAVAERQKEMLRERMFDAWTDGVRSGRRGLCVGVDEDIPQRPDPITGTLELRGTVRTGILGRTRPSDPYQPHRFTTDPQDPRLTHGVDTAPTQQADAYLVLGPDGDGGEGPRQRPLRYAYRHVGGCGEVTTLAPPIAQTYARDPGFYGATYCVGCRMHRPLAEFHWVAEPGEVIPAEQQVVGS